MITNFTDDHTLQVGGYGKVRLISPFCVTDTGHMFINLQTMTECIGNLLVKVMQVYK